MTNPGKRRTAGKETGVMAAHVKAARARKNADSAAVDDEEKDGATAAA